MRDGAAASAGERGATVLAVVVVHGRAWDAAASMPLLRRWLDGGFEAVGAPRLAQVLVRDNSPRPAGAPVPAGGSIVVVHDPANGGTRGAYVDAAERAEGLAAGWLLLLDQDTLLPDAFPAAVGDALRGAGPEVAAAVPRVLHDGVPVSPAVVLPSGRVTPRPLEAGAADGEVPTAIASGTLLRAADLRAMRPVPPEFWLDYLDHWMFLRLHRGARRVAPIGCEIAHHLSVQDPSTMGEARYRNLLRAERRFVDELPLRARLSYRLRVGLRALRLARRAPALSRLALRAALGARG